MISDAVIEEIALNILYSSIEDQEFLTTVEMTSDFFEYGAGEQMLAEYRDHDEETWHRVHDLMATAQVTITFPKKK
jgi:hypothetical protein